MQYRTYNKTGEKVSLLGFGAMRLPETPEGKIDAAESVKMIRFAIDSGVNYVDTAYSYNGGASEEAVGKALKDGYREKVFLADKMPIWLAGDASGIPRIFNEQFKRLEVDVIDMYLAHNMTAPLWKLMKKFNALDFLEKKKSEGKIKHIGFSFHDEPALFREIIDAFDWDFCQIQLNYMDAEYQAGVEGLKYAADKGIQAVIMEPVKGGLLTDALPESVKKFWNGADTQRTPAEWALRWVADFPEVLTILSGMSTMAQVEENIRILSGAQPGGMTEKEHDIIRKVAGVYNELIQYPCTSCRYCLPCEQKINIPLAMSMYNNWFLYAQSEKIKNSYKLWFTEGRAASDCTKCKSCEDRCPQHLNISEMMEKAADIFEK